VVMDSGLAARGQVYAGCVDLPALRRPGMTERSAQSS